MPSNPCRSQNTAAVTNQVAAIPHLTLSGDHGTSIRRFSTGLATVPHLDSWPYCDEALEADYYMMNG